MTYPIKPTIEQFEDGLRAIAYAFLWGKLVGKGIILETTSLTEIKSLLDKEIEPHNFILLTDQEFCMLVLCLKPIRTEVKNQVQEP